MTTLWYRMWLMSSSCSKLNQNVRIAVPSIRMSIHCVFAPFCIQPMTLATMGSSLCHARICSSDQGWTHLPEDVFASKFITWTWWPRQPMSSTLSIDSCLSQWWHSWHGLLYRPSAFLCCTPGRYWISKLYSLRTCNYHQSCPSGFLKLMSHCREPWSVWILKWRPYK